MRRMHFLSLWNVIVAQMICGDSSRRYTGNALTHNSSRKNAIVIHYSLPVTVLR